MNARQLLETQRAAFGRRAGVCQVDAQELPKALNWRAFGVLLEHARKNDWRGYVAMRLAASAGLRPQELCLLHVGDFECHEGRWHMLVGRLKRRDAWQHWVPLAEDVAALALRLGSPRHVDEPLFEGASARGAVHRQWFSDVMRRACRATGEFRCPRTEKCWCGHSIRHMVAQTLADQGWASSRVASFLGQTHWRSAETYTDAARKPSTLAPGAEALTAALGVLPPLN